MVQGSVVFTVVVFVGCGQAHAELKSKAADARYEECILICGGRQYIEQYTVGDASICKQSKKCKGATTA